jgi:hypothetical protein
MGHVEKPMNEWKPIASAPRDGSMILAYIPDCRFVVAVSWRRVQVNGEWRDLGWDTPAFNGWDMDMTGEPTHWMLAPKLPEGL